MTHRLGAHGKNTSALFATLGLAAVLTAAGCGSSGGSGGFTLDSGTEDVSNVKVDSGAPDTGMSEAASGVCPTPTFNPPSGTSDPGNVAISATGLPAIGVIYYTTDGTNPSPSSPTYSSPIQISADTTIRAASLAAGVCTLSAVALATYTVTPLEGGALGTVVFNPMSETEPNDFPVVLSASPSSATICYTLDGTMPACTAGVCSGNSKTYAAANPLSVNGSVTNPATGQVTVTAISCEPGEASSTAQSQTYTLQAAAPTMATPAPAANIPWVAGGFTPTISSATLASLTPVDAPAIFVTVDGAAPGCGTGVDVSNPSTFGSASLTAPLNTNVTGNHVYQALTCKAGYLPSAVQTFTYSFQLVSPNVSGTGTYNDPPSVALTTATPPPVPGITDPNNTAASSGWDYLCYDLTGVASCEGSGACGTGSLKLAGAVAIGSKTSAATTLSVVACNAQSGHAGGINNSAAGSATYTLQYAPPWLYSSAVPGDGGWDYLGTAATPGQPSASLSIPVSAGANPWAGTFSAYQVADLGGQAQPSNTLLPQAGYPATKPWSTAVSAFPSYTVPDYMCWQYCAKGATCAALTCGGGGACVTAAGKSGQVTFADAPGGTNALPATLAVSAGDAISLIGCASAPANPPTEIVYSASAVTTVTFAAAGAASPPSVSAATVTPYTVQAAPTVSNNDPSQSTICWTYSATAVSPTCTNSVCNVPAVTLTGNDSAKGSLLLAPTGSPQGSAITNLTKTANNMTITVGTTAGFANGMPIVVAGNSVAANNGIFTINAAPGAATLQYANAAGVAGTTGGTVGGYTTAIFNTATSAAYGTSPVANAPPLGLVQRDGYVLSAIACNSAEAASSVASQLYNFTVAQPDFTSSAGYLARNYGDLDLATTIGAGAPLWLTTTSNFDSTPVVPEKVESIAYAVGGGSAACGSATSVNLQKVIASGTASGLADVWDNGTSPATTQIGPSGNVLLTAPTTGTTWTLSAVGCGESLTAQEPSTPRTTTFSVTAAAPTVLTNQDPNAGSCGASPLPACCAASNTCAPAAEWERTFNVTLTSTTAGTSICYSTSQAPSCSSATGKCTGAGVVQVASGTAGATVAIANSPTTLYVQGCAPNLGVPAAQTYSFDIFTTPPTLVLPAGGVCNTSTSPTVELATTVASPVDKTDLALGGPSPGSCVCYTTDTSAAQCVNATAGGCNYAPAGAAVGNGFGGPAGTTVHCFNGGGTAKVTVTATTTINMSTCAFGLDVTSASQVYATGAYTHTIKVDGNITEWTQPAEAANLYYDIEDEHPFCSNLAGVGLFTYDAANLYVGGSIGGSMLGACCDYSGGCQHGACVGNAGTWIVGYIGNNSGSGATVELPMLDPNRILTGARAVDPAIGIEYAFAYDTSGTPATVSTFQWTGGAWSAFAFPVSVAMNLATNTFELGIPFSGIGVTSTSTVTFFGAAIADVGTAQTVGDGSNELFRFPATNYLNCEANGGPCAAFTYASYYEDNLASCLNPNNNVRNVSGSNSGGLSCFAGP